MSSLSSRLSLTKNFAHASLPNNGSSSSSSSSSSSLSSSSLHVNGDSTKLQMRKNRTTTPPLPRKNAQRRKPTQPTVIEIQRAIGAGRFRDSDNSDVEEENVANFDMSMMNFSKFEGTVEKQLRETGEWVTNETEKRQKYSAIYVTVGTTNLGINTPSCRGSHQAKHPICQ